MWSFGALRFDPVRRTLQSPNASLRLPPREADLLLALLDAGGTVVTKEHLLERIWADCAVEEGNLAQQISLLRRALHSLDEQTPYIETLPKVGYRLLVPVHLSAETAPRLRRRLGLGIALAAVAALGSAAYFAGIRQETAPVTLSRIEVHPVRNATGDPGNQAFCQALQDALSAGLIQAELHVTQLPPDWGNRQPLRTPALQSTLDAEGKRLLLRVGVVLPDRKEPVRNLTFYFSSPPSPDDVQAVRITVRESFRPD